MTEAAGKGLAPELQAWVDTWKTCTEQVLSQVSGQTMAFEMSAEPLPGADSDLWYTIVAGGTLRGEKTLRLSADSATRLAQKFLSETEPSGGPTSEHKEALEELLRQISGQTATALASSVGGEVQFHLAASASPSWPAAATACIRTRDEAGTPIIIEIQISAALASALQPRSETPAARPAAPPPPAAVASYERLMDVGLEVKLRFGSRRMVLRDVLALSAGVVVELESNVNSPVDLLLDGRVVAQGEVVVVDGKYGLRVTQVVSTGSPA
ncbi:MAG: FliM/FliN family flagellar motor switch protein [Acidobacteriales bacterium]|nr:FliM/FliN family flagellar motor switch protein [Candidatus Koribacter versatilis]MBI3646146.1 FliM/FliN family flagellar motor switch protein [Terriglobales bacterium]